VGTVVPLDGKQTDHAQPDVRAAFDVLSDLVGQDLTRVNKVVLRRLESRVALIPQLAGHIIASGGKRLRPMLTLATARMCGYEGDRHINLAATVEFIHTATLLHDDVVDESDLRRGKATANSVWGNDASVLVGDFLFSRAFQLMVDDGDLRVLEILSGASAVIAEGEVLQLMTTNDTETTEDAYLRVISAKTAALFAAACQIGAVVCERPRAEEEALLSFGRNLGIAFQLVDDALDYSARQMTLGKTVGDDFREGKMSLPVILAFARGSESERAFWRLWRSMERSTTRLNAPDITVLLLAMRWVFSLMGRLKRHSQTSSIFASSVLTDCGHSSLVKAAPSCTRRARTSFP